MKYTFLILLFFINAYHLGATHISSSNQIATLMAAVERPPATKKKKKKVRQQHRNTLQEKKTERKAKRKAKKSKQNKQQSARVNQKLKVGFIMYGITLFFILAIFLVLSIWSAPLGLGGVIIGLILGIFTTSVLGIIGLVYTILGLNELPQTEMGLATLGTTAAVVIFLALCVLFWGTFANLLAAIVAGLFLILAIIGLWVSIKNR